MIGSGASSGVSRLSITVRISAREQRWLLDSIRGDLDLSRHWAGAVNSLRIVLAEDESIRTGWVVELG